MVLFMDLSVKARIGKKRVLVIPKKIADRLGIDEGTTVKITVVDDKMIIEPVRDAIWLSLYGEKVAEVTIEKLEDISIEEQEKVVKGRKTFG